MALDKGAQAVIFDISDDANAAVEVSVHQQLWLQLLSQQMLVQKQRAGMSPITACCVSPPLLLLPSLCNTQLRKTDSLPLPVVLVKAKDAEVLMDLVNKNEEAKVVIEINMGPKWVSTDINAQFSISQYEEVK